ncbi:MAG: CooT family nickel-binding protein [Dehalococcoidales bacterium]|nr:CooT family nickel-binding protein [Dehalococcoidales bacterium]
MCLAKAYLKDGEKDELLVEAVASLEIMNGKLLLRTIFGEEKEIAADIKNIDFTHSKIKLEPRN